MVKVEHTWPKVALTWPGRYIRDQRLFQRNQCVTLVENGRSNMAKQVCAGLKIALTWPESHSRGQSLF